MQSPAVVEGRGMGRHPHKWLGIGDQVQYIDPQKGQNSVPCTIVDILTEDKKVEDMETVVILQTPEGDRLEAYIFELG